METGALSRGLAVIDALTRSTDGLPLNRVAEELDLPKSAAHRILANLIRDGYVWQDEESGRYALTLRIVSMAHRLLADRPIVDWARPPLERLAGDIGELVRLGLVEGDEIVWVLKFQGARTGLRFDPMIGATVSNLAASASGIAWLSQLSEPRAVELLLRDGMPESGRYGPAAPGSIAEALERISLARARGYSSVRDSYEEGTSAMAVPILDARGTVSGVVSVAGPTVRLTAERIEAIAPGVLATAHELSRLVIPASADHA